MSVRRAGTAVVATRRPILPRSVVVGLVFAVLSLVYLGAAAARQTDDGDLAFMPAAPAPEVSTAVAGPTRHEANPVSRNERRDVATTGVFAEVDGLALHLPHVEPLTVAYHEAMRPEALPLEPVGRLETNDNPTRFAPPPDVDGPAYRILSSRGRGRPATSAVDVVTPDGGRANAVVSGEVVEVRQYALYGGLQDWRVVVVPDGRPDLHVVMIHLHEPQVEVGDRVTGGVTPIAVARLLPFTSHVDYTQDGGRDPHVHIEVKPATAAAPLDPNEPAVMPEEHVDIVG